MESKLTISVIARQAGVSTATVSRYLSGKGPVSDALAARLQSIIQDYNHDDRNLSRVFKKQKNRTVGVVVQQLAHPYFIQVCSALEAECRQHDWPMLLGVGTDQAAEEEKIIKTFLDKSVDALVLAGGTPRFETLPPRFEAVIRSAAERCAVIFLNGYASVPGVFNVRADEWGGFQALLDRALAMGHQRFAYIGGNSETGTARTRRAAMLDWAERNSVPLNPDWIVDAGFTIQEGMQAVESFLTWKERPTVITCCNDVVAAGVIKALNARGFRVPQDMSVLGFDGIDYRDYPFPALSSVSQNYSRLARAVFDCIDSPDSRHEIVVSTSQIEGETLGPVPEM